MEFYRITKPIAVIVDNKLKPTSIAAAPSLLPLAHSAKHLFNNMDEYNALAKKGRFAPSKALIDCGLRQKNDSKMFTCIINNKTLSLCLNI